MDKKLMVLFPLFYKDERVYIGVKVAVLLGSVAGAAAEALEKAAGAQTRPAHSPTGTALGGGGVGGKRERGSPRGWQEEEEKQKEWSRGYDGKMHTRAKEE